MDAIDAIDLRSLRVFEAVARHCSFSEAAREFSMPRANASKLVAQLEDAIGGKLFRRTTRKVGLTELGERLLSLSQGHVAPLRAALAEARAGTTEVAGVVRFSVSTAYGRSFILPLLPDFRLKHPKVSVEAILSDTIDDLVLKTLDFSIRLGPLPETSMVARRIGTLEIVLAATPKLVGEAPAMSAINDLTHMPMISFRVPGSGAILPWAFRKDGQSVGIDTSAAAYTMNAIEGIADMVRAGAGVAPLPRFLIEDALASGQLIQLFPDHRFADIPVHICFQDREMMPARVRLLIDAIVEGAR